MGPYCIFCERRCFVYLPWEELTEEMHNLYKDYYTQVGGFSIDIIATCPGGQAQEKERIGVCYDDIKALREARQQEEVTTLFDQAVARAVAIARPFEDHEVFQPAWDAGYELVPQMDARFVLYREANGKQRRLWSVQEKKSDLLGEYCWTHDPGGWDCLHCCLIAFFQAIGLWVIKEAVCGRIPELALTYKIQEGTRDYPTTERP
jgi:hypothetical protein